MRKPVSVIIPCYNDEKYIAECLDSVVNQIDADKLLEVIVVNDGCTDNSQTIIDKYTEKYDFVTSYLQKNGGLSAARNTGARLANGDYLYFLDSDDYISNDMIKKCYEAAISTDSDIVTFKTKPFFDDDSDGLIMQKYTRTMSASKTYNGKELFSYMVKHNEFYPSIWLHFYKNEFYKNNNFSFIEGIIYEDTPFSYKAINSAEKVFFIDSIFHFRRTRCNSLIRAKIKPKHIYSNNVGIEFMANWYLEEKAGNSRSLKEELEFLQRIAAGNIITIMQSDNEDNKKKAEKKAYKAVLKKYPFLRSSQMLVCWLKGLKSQIKLFLKK